MKDYQVRVVAESEEVNIKINRLDKFIKSNKAFWDLDPEERTLMVQQLAAMRVYNDILIKRIKYWK